MNVTAQCQVMSKDVTFCSLTMPTDGGTFFDCYLEGWLCLDDFKRLATALDAQFGSLSDTETTWFWDNRGM